MLVVVHHVVEEEALLELLQDLNAVFEDELKLVLVGYANQDDAWVYLRVDLEAGQVEAYLFHDFDEEMI